ncbi:class I SAM-dependent methyltransferase [Dysgonomonas sp. Marseille-P4677]|uniref:class I SAM-dependent methyltransferase n=1 Tax=Dysgonomonas sp. Marseille-P4677 TaxID=2364790 RepID=UPI001914D06A|nr:class I SAM-dependent methyltransferase [Dysgonomonas sp. Marseille-P4677]MBK5721415.1 class I SAM-dependent methyltransferase [Dysgonomonas sp. Marseille-P4677]
MKEEDYYFSERKELLKFISPKIERTLDVGCASGTFSEQLKNKFDIETWGIEMVEEYALIAKEKLDYTLHGTFDEVYEKLPKNYFDCIFFNDVLEHMVEPENCLKKVKQNLMPGKTVIASIPNIRYINILKNLILKRDWKYEDSGILDHTHLRFFTKKSIVRMFENCGYKINRIEGIRSISPYCLTSIINLLAFNSLDDIKHQQFVVVASPL